MKKSRGVFLVSWWRLWAPAILGLQTVWKRVQVWVGRRLSSRVPGAWMMPARGWWVWVLRVFWRAVLSVMSVVAVVMVAPVWRSWLRVWVVVGVGGFRLSRRRCFAP